ncbi:hypothetical protein PFISCL1PPCAC_27023, partial [Pristionchus fissidentatus]
PTTASPGTETTINPCLYIISTGRLRVEVDGFVMSNEGYSMCYGPCRKVPKQVWTAKDVEWGESETQVEEQCGCGRWIEFSYDLGQEMGKDVGNPAWKVRVETDERAMDRKVVFSDFLVRKRID